MTNDGPRLGRLVLRPYRVPLARAWKSARGRTLERRGWLVGVEDADGARGIGECAPLEGAGTEPPAAALAALQAAMASMPGLVPSAALERLPGLEREAHPITGQIEQFVLACSASSAPTEPVPAP